MRPRLALTALGLVVLVACDAVAPRSEDRDGGRREALPESGPPAGDASSGGVVREGGVWGARDSGPEPPTTSEAGPPDASLEECPLRRPETPPRPALPDVTGGEVSSYLSDDAGGWFLAGTFTGVVGEPVQGLAHVLADGTLAPGLRHGVDFWCGVRYAGTPATCLPAHIQAMAKTGTRLFVAGTFTRIAGQRRRYLAAFDLASGELTPWHGARLPSADEDRQRTSCTLGEDYGYRSIVTNGTAVFAAHCDLQALSSDNGEPLEGFVAPRFRGSHGWDDILLTVAEVDARELVVSGDFDEVWRPSNGHDPPPSDPEAPWQSFRCSFVNRGANTWESRWSTVWLDAATGALLR